VTGSTPAPAAAEAATEAAPEPILEVRELRTQFETDAGMVRAVDGVSFNVMPGETLGIVGESGSGKSVTALSIMKLLPDQARIAGGEIVFRGRDILRMTGEEIRSLRGGRVAMVFQDPMTSLNPVLRISKQLVETMLVHGRHDRPSALRRAIALLGRMGITAPERAVDSFPHQFSGGMRQRVMLAMGFANEPSLLIADEPTTALDVTIQAQILDLLRELNADFGAAIILISHDLGVIANVCRRVVVMYAGEIVEEGTTEALLADPKHPYTWALLNAVPRLDRHTPGEKRLTTIEGTPPDPLNWPPGCRFAVRCPFRIEKCAEHPALLPVGEGRLSRCWVTQQGATLPQRPLPRALPRRAPIPRRRPPPSRSSRSGASSSTSPCPRRRSSPGRRRCTRSMASISTWPGARLSASSASRAAASRPSPASSSASSVPMPARSASPATTLPSPAAPRSVRSAAACR
jgi:peptide/nickel transport system ATP-binding protein